jgi:hypothetical protein
MSVRLKRSLFALIFSAGMLGAQQELATLRGTVLNTSGEPVANVSVVISDLTAGMDVRTAVTDKTGNYEARYLKAASYKITIEERGYQTFSADNITLVPGEVRRYDPKLTAGSAEDTTEVHTAPVVIDTQTGTLRQVIDNKIRWNDAPMAGKVPSPFPLMTTTPGVQGNGNGLVIAGISDRNRQTYALDGLADDSTPGIYVHPLFFEFMQVTQANPSAASYRPTGFDLVSKRGIDGVHGQIYYMRGSSNFDAPKPFLLEKSSYRQGEEGGDIGSLIFRGYTYLYGGFVRQTNPYNQTLAANVPTAKMRVGDFSQYLDPKTSPTGQVVVIRDPRNGVPFPNNQIPSNRLAATSNNVLSNYYPAPNIADTNSVYQNYTWAHPFGPNLYKGYWPIVRWDQKLAAQNTFYVRWVESVNSSIAPGTIGEVLNSTQSRKYQHLMVSDTEAFSPSLVNRFSIARMTDLLQQGESEKITPVTGGQALGNIGIQGTNINGYATMGFPSISIAGFTGMAMTYAGADSNQAQNDRSISLQDGLTWSRGRHNITLGGNYSRMNWTVGTVPQITFGSFNFTGTFTGLAFADFLLGYPGTSSRLLNPRVNNKIRQDIAGVYLSDSVRVSSRLTVDIGLRWDYFDSPVYEDGYMYNFNPATGGIVVAPGTLTAISSLFPKTIPVSGGRAYPHPKTTNFRPRLSAAYRISNNTVVRGGFGEFTDSGGFGPFGRLNDPNGPFSVTETYVNSSVNNVPLYSFPRPFPGSPTASQNPNPGVTGFPFDTEEGVIRQFNGTLEHAIHGMAVRLSYIGARATGINYSLNVNKPRAGTAPFAASRLPYPLLGTALVTRADGEWRYDSAQAQARKRVGPVTFDASFTLANNVANYLNTFDPYNVTSHWTRDAANRRRYFTASGYWDLPVGKGKRILTDAGPFVNFFLGNWSAQAIVTFASGQYYSPFFTGADPANASNTIVTALPDCVGDPNAGARTLNRWFNPAAFAVPPSGRYGNCGMNVLEGPPIHVAHAGLAKRVPLGESLAAIFTVQVSNVTNTTHFLFPNNNISLPGAGTFGVNSVPADTYPERIGPRQLDLKLRIQW